MYLLNANVYTWTYRVAEWAWEAELEAALEQADAITSTGGGEASSLSETAAGGGGLAAGSVLEALLGAPLGGAPGLVEAAWESAADETLADGTSEPPGGAGTPVDAQVAAVEEESGDTNAAASHELLRVLIAAKYQAAPPPTPMEREALAPSPVAPSPVAPSPVAPSPVAPSSVASPPVAPAPVAPAPFRSVTAPVASAPVAPAPSRVAPAPATPSATAVLPTPLPLPPPPAAPLASEAQRGRWVLKGYRTEIAYSVHTDPVKLDLAHQANDLSGAEIDNKARARRPLVAQPESHPWHDRGPEPE